VDDSNSIALKVPRNAFRKRCEGFRHRGHLSSIEVTAARDPENDASCTNEFKLCVACVGLYRGGCTAVIPLYASGSGIIKDSNICWRQGEELTLAQHSFVT
jgi:hypothetical protein